MNDIIDSVKEEIKNENLQEIYDAIIGFLFGSIIASVIGFFFCKFNNFDIRLGIIGGMCLPSGYIFVDIIFKYLHTLFEQIYTFLCVITLNIFAIFAFFLKLYVAFYVGIDAGPIFLVYFAFKIYHINTTDYTKQAQERINSSHFIDANSCSLVSSSVSSDVVYSPNVKDSSVLEISSTPDVNNDFSASDEDNDLDDDLDDDLIDENECCYCERCFKKISLEDYELYDGMCEDCFYDVYDNHLPF